MYSGTTLNNKSGALIGTHQKVDRVARRFLRELNPNDTTFPKIKELLHFEGKNGPDGIKTKSPAQDEPWHFYDPFDADDTKLLKIIHDHYSELVSQLKNGNTERAAFEASWLAHAVVDGLTPAHHHPYEEELDEITGGTGNEGRNTLKNKVVMPGDTPSEKLKSNWAMYGWDGLMSRHGLFEIGVGVLLASVNMKASRPTDKDLAELADVGYEEMFKRAAREIALMDMFKRFYDKGWSVKLSRDVRNHLGPVIIKTVALVWHSALQDSRGKV